MENNKSNINQNIARSREEPFHTEKGEKLQENQYKQSLRNIYPSYIGSNIVSKVKLFTDIMLYDKPFLKG